MEMTAPRHVFLFSGHMIDGRDRATPRFPWDKEPVAAAAIAQALDDFGVGAQDLGITEGACGGDLLFAEALLQRGARLELRLPFDEATFLKNSVDYPKAKGAPDDWRARFMRARSQARVLVMPDVLGPTSRDESPYERCNIWMLGDALAFGATKLRFVCLWNGEGGDGPGGTRHMVQVVREEGGEVRWLDTRKLW